MDPRGLIINKMMMMMMMMMTKIVEKAV